jgi:hypothetical protein
MKLRWGGLSPQPDNVYLITQGNCLIFSTDLTEKKYYYSNNEDNNDQSRIKSSTENITNSLATCECEQHDDHA